MKINLFSLFVLILMAVASCQEKIDIKEEIIDIEKERAAIIEMLYEEGELFAAFDMESLSSLHVQDESDTRLAGTEIYKGVTSEFIKINLLTLA